MTVAIELNSVFVWAFMCIFALLQLDVADTLITKYYPDPYKLSKFTGLLITIYIFYVLFAIKIAQDRIARQTRRKMSRSLTGRERRFLSTKCVKNHVRETVEN